MTSENKESRTKKSRTQKSDGNDYTHISCETLFNEQERWLIVDIRDAHSFALSHVKGASPLTNENIGVFLTNVESSQPVAVMCYHGNSSQQAANYLTSQGLKNVASVDGGFEFWRQHYPISEETEQ